MIEELSSISQNLRKLPGSSGIVTATIASLSSPRSARSAIYLNLSKLTFEPYTTDTIFLFFKLFSKIYFLTPAVERATAGSETERKSS